MNDAFDSSGTGRAQTTAPPPPPSNAAAAATVAAVGVAADDRDDDGDDDNGGGGDGGGFPAATTATATAPSSSTALLSDRVEELETKLAVLSRILALQQQQQQQHNHHQQQHNNSFRRVGTPPPVPLRGGGGGGGAAAPVPAQQQSPLAPTLLSSDDDEEEEGGGGYGYGSAARGRYNNNRSSAAASAAAAAAAAAAAKRTASIPHLESPCIDAGRVASAYNRKSCRRQRPTAAAQFPEALLPDDDNNDAAAAAAFDDNDDDNDDGDYGTSRLIGSDESPVEKNRNDVSPGGQGGGRRPSLSSSSRHRRRQQQSPPPPPPNDGSSSTPASSSLESSPVQPHKRNLSFRLLFDGDEDAYQENNQHDTMYSASVPPSSSLTPAERQWLQPKALQYCLDVEAQKKKHEHRQERQQQAEDETAAASPSNADDVSATMTVATPSSILTGADGSSSAEQQQQERRRRKSSSASTATEAASNLRDGNSHNNAPSNSAGAAVIAVASPDRNDEKKKIKDEEDDDEDAIRNYWLSYLNSFQESTPDVDQRMQEFIQVPGAVERLLGFGLLICLDSFLYMITVLPIRFVWSCWLLALRLLPPYSTSGWTSRRRKGGADGNDSSTPAATRSNSPWRFHRQHSYQLIQVFILYSIYRYVLLNISIGKLYHWIRGQSMIKLYVLIAMVEVFDRLFSSLGQDCLDSLYWNTVNRPRSFRMIIAVVVVWVYATLHALILFIHVETLNVAMNSDDQALLTLLISGNFAEIKSTVFKKYNKPALFKITASDICERFKLGLFLSLILLLNVCQGVEQGQLAAFWRICGIVWCAELLSDWIKHSFITKFNFLPSKVYPEYALLLAGDVTGIGHEGVNLDHSHAVVKRIGFAQTPLVCLMFRLLREAAKYARRNPYWQTSFIGTLCVNSRWAGLAAGVLGWTLLLCVKMALGSLLQRTSLARLRAAPDLVPIKKLPKQKKL